MVVTITSRIIGTLLSPLTMIASRGIAHSLYVFVLWHGLIQKVCNFLGSCCNGILNAVSRLPSLVRLLRARYGLPRAAGLWLLPACLSRNPNRGVRLVCSACRERKRSRPWRVRRRDKTHARHPPRRRAWDRGKGHRAKYNVRRG